jgi:hypothetical protein
MEHYWCSHCGGQLDGPKIKQCPHCGVLLDHTAQGTLEQYQDANRQFARWKQNKWRKENAKLIKRVKNILVILLAVVTCLAILAFIYLGVKALVSSASLSNPSLRAVLMSASIFVGAVATFWLIIELQGEQASEGIRMFREVEEKRKQMSRYNLNENNPIFYAGYSPSSKPGKGTIWKLVVVWTLVILALVAVYLYP